MRVLLVLGVVASLAFAGCLEDGDASLDSKPVVDDFPFPAETSFNASIAWELVAAAGSPALIVNAGAILGVPAGGTIQVPANATSFTAVAEGSCTSGPVCSLALVAFRDGEQEAFIEGMLPLELTVDGPATGEWSLVMFPDMNGAVAVGAVGSITVNGTALQ